MKAVTLKEQIEHAKYVIETYRNSWFWKGRWAGDPADWRRWLIAHKTLRTLRSLRHLR